MSRFVLATLVVSWTCSRVALAADSPDSIAKESLRIELQGPVSCADGDDLFAQVHARTERVRLAGGREDPDVAVVVRLQESPGRTGFAGDLALTTKHGGVSHRHLTGETCDALISGLGLVTALAIDPMASTSLRVLAMRSPPDPPPPPPSPPPMPAVITVVPSQAEPPPEPTTETAPTKVGRWRVTVGAHLGFLGTGAPGVVGDGDLFGDLALDGARMLAPSLRLSVHRTLEMTQNASGAPGEAATLAWTYVRAEGCPLRFDLTDAVVVRPCALLDVGALSATGQGAPVNQSPLQPWATAGALARLEWTQPTGPGGWALVLEASGGLVFPIVRQSFSFDPTTAASTVYQAPAVTGVASLGAGLRFP